jgi:hypothetical protein
MDMKDVARARQIEDERQEAIRQAALRRRNTLIASSTALALTLVGSVTAFVQLRLERSHRDDSVYVVDSLEKLHGQDRQIAFLTERLNSVIKSNEELQKSIGSTGVKGGPSHTVEGLSIADRQLLEEARQSAADLSQRITTLENALLQTPEKALAVPLLRQQLIDIEDKDKGDSENIHGEINRLYGMMQWFLGLMITLIIGVGGLVANSFRQNADRNRSIAKPEEQEK